MTTVLGLPGLYQNWLTAVIDPISKFMFQGSNNFIALNHQVNWVKKMTIDFDHDNFHGHDVINCYVRNENFVWYLYNFLEKTDGVGICIDSLIIDLFSKAPGTVAFDQLLKHLIDTYELHIWTDSAYHHNACIEYFYFVLLENTSKFKKFTAHHDDKFLNIEYNDFNSSKKLIECLQCLPTFDLTRFDNMYKLLCHRNSRYLTRQQQFLSKLNSNTVEFDILEWAYIGVLLYWQDGVILDWFNVDVRQNILKNHRSDLCIYAKKLL